MKFTLSWLKDHLDTSADAAQIAQALTRVGLEVERVEDKGALLAPYVVASVLSVEPHPNADRLKVCRVDAGGDAPVQVVCGAPNARAGMKSVFSPPGTFIPGKNITLTVGVIRGVESAGMLVSGFELGLSDDHDGILDLPADAPVGAAFADHAGLNDPVFDVAVTPNRPDALGVAGIARDLAAAGLGRLIERAIQPVRGRMPCPTGVRLDFSAADKGLCPAFALRLVRGVRNGPSPDWMQRRLKAIGLRPINALVDITNYLTFDRGRPLHVFDLAKIDGDLVVRRARDGEETQALDGKTYRLDPDMVVIADDRGVESIAGVMGAERSGCDARTRDVLIESALWDPSNIARTGRKLAIHSDARHRFERGVDPGFCLPGLELATRLVLEFCGGEPSDIVLEGAIPDTDRVIEFPLTEVKRLTGLDLPDYEAKLILRELGFWVSGHDRLLKVSPPSWRPDIEGKADLVEEITRIAGLDRVPSTPFPRDSAIVVEPALTPAQRRVGLARRALAARGLLEAVTWSFIAKREAESFGGGQAALSLANPIASDLSDMRPSLLPGLVKAARRNADRGFSDLALFEVGQIFRGDRPQDQAMAAAAIRRGLAKASGPGRIWSGPATPVDAFEAKADALALLEALGAPVGGLQIVPGAPAWFHPGRSGTLQFGPKSVVGHFGELHPKALEALNSKGSIIACEIILDTLPEPKNRPTKAKPKLALPDFQPVSRDFAFVVARSVSAADILRAVRGADRALIANVEIFDIYEGAGIPTDKKSVGTAVTLQPLEKTLTDEEIDAIAARIVAEVGKKTGAVLRG